MVARTLWIVLIALIASAPARACLRVTADKRAIQWSDAIVHARLEKIVDPASEMYSFTVTDTTDGSLKPDEKIVVHHVIPNGAAPACGGHLTPDDLGKTFRLL